MAETPVEILLVEDNPADAELTQHAFATAKVANRVHVVEDGDTALDFLYRRGEHHGAPRPDLILLDLNLPGLDGREVLETVKGDDDLMEIPVVILTTSVAEADIRETYRHHANAFMNKPVRFEDFAEIVKSIENYWFVLVRLPPKPRHPASEFSR